MKRCGYLIFAGLLCLVLFTACTGRKSPAGTEDSAVQSGLSDMDMTAEEKLGVPETADYGGETFNILSAGNVAWEDFKLTRNPRLRWIMRSTSARRLWSKITMSILCRR